MILVAMFAASPCYAWLAGGQGRYNDIDLAYFAIDATCLVLLVSLAIQSDRWWLLWISGAQLIATLSHFVRLLDVSFAPLAYALMMRAPSWLELVILICGTALGNSGNSRPACRARARGDSTNIAQVWNAVLNQRDFRPD